MRPIVNAFTNRFIFGILISKTTGVNQYATKEPKSKEEARAWVINIACKKPTEYGYAAEMWTRSALADHARRYGPEAGHDCLKKAVKATIQRILDEHP